LTRRLHALTALRFFASMHIVLHHYAHEALATAPVWLDALRQRAHISLSIFFVLSGFVISYRYLEPVATGAVSRGDFWRGRFARVFPLYFVAWLIETLVRIVRGSGMVYSDYLVGNAAHLLGVQAWARSLGFAANVPAWTVSTEIVFYALFPFVAAGFVAATRRRLWMIAGALMLVGALPNLADAAFHVDKTMPFATPYLFGWAKDRWPPFRAAEFLLGVTLARLFATGGGPRRGHWAIALVACVALVPILTLPAARLPAREICRALYVPLSALLVYGLAHGRGPTPSAIRGPLVALGDASYAIYILQAPVHFVITMTLAPDWDGRPWFLAQYLVLLLVVAFVAHRAIERPANEYLRGR
jgi:peptidoglycan/LPS O-acetylase OafA/YrhL